MKVTSVWRDDPGPTPTIDSDLWLLVAALITVTTSEIWGDDEAPHLGRFQELYEGRRIAGCPIEISNTDPQLHHERAKAKLVSIWGDRPVSKEKVVERLVSIAHAAGYFTRIDDDRIWLCQSIAESPYWEEETGSYLGDIGYIFHTIHNFRSTNSCSILMTVELNRVRTFDRFERY